ncbi:phage tail protein [Planctobacterium marinum]|uniref:phage tail protein n=1 Tax=Planctobacterium marinum TaxID=1631968 RepID=UPI001E2B5922|nr:tail fiber protein [Planctobacterium marinum]MCC2606360.1 tail fiber protein [Planctobacterium marinum]
MSEGYYGEIRIFGGTYAPAKWSFCDGQILSISSNSTLYSLLGTYYGGDGRTSFGLPDLRGRIPVHQGIGPGLTPRAIGQRYGLEAVSLTLGEMPAHTHTLQASNNDATSNTPVDNVLANMTNQTGLAYKTFAAGDTPIEMADNQVQNSGSGTSHENMMPWNCLSFIICIQGLYPSRS